MFFRKINHKHLAVVEVLLSLVLIYFCFTSLSNYFFITRNEDPDPDGYISHAYSLMSEGKSPLNHHRLAGYPIFIALSQKLMNGDIFLTPLHFQKYFFILALLSFWYLVRTHISKVTALLLLVFLYLPNLFSRSVMWIYPDFLFSVFTLLTMLLVYVFVFKTYKKAVNFLFVSLIALFTIISSSFRPNAGSFLLVFLFCIGLTLLITSFRQIKQKNYFDFKIKMKRFIFITLLSLAVAHTTKTMANPGGVDKFLNSSLAMKVVSDTDCVSSNYSSADSEFEQANQRIHSAKQLALQNATNSSLPNRLSSPAMQLQWDFYTAGAPLKVSDAQIVYKKYAFLCFHQMLGSGLSELKFTYHELIKNFNIISPNFRNVTSINYNVPATLSAQQVFLLTGFHFNFTENATEFEKFIEILKSLTFAALFFINLYFGLKKMISIDSALSISFLLTFVMQALVLATFVFLDARYLLHFFIPLYLVQIIGVLELAKLLTSKIYFNPKI